MVGEFTIHNSMANSARRNVILCADCSHLEFVWQIYEYVRGLVIYETGAQHKQEVDVIDPRVSRLR